MTRSTGWGREDDDNGPCAWSSDTGQTSMLKLLSIDLISELGLGWGVVSSAKLPAAFNLSLALLGPVFQWIYAACEGEQRRYQTVGAPSLPSQTFTTYERIIIH